MQDPALQPADQAPGSVPGPWQSGVIVVCLLAVATGVGLALEPRASLTSVAMLYVLVVVLVAYTQERLASILCAVGAVVALNFFFVPPRWTLVVDSQEHLVALSTMLLVALVISHLAAGLRRETALAHLNAQRAGQLQELAAALAQAQTPQDVGALGLAALKAAFAGPSHIALLDETGALTATQPVDAGVQDGMAACIREAAVLGPGTGRWPGLNAWYVPLGQSGRLFGALCVQSVQAADTAAREHAVALATLLAQALLRQNLAHSMQTARQEAQRQQLQNTFLAAISHDLRTPLAALVGAASSLQTQRDKLGVAEQERLLGSIVGEAEYLAAITENTLQLVQLNNAPRDIRKGWESMEEIVGTVLARARRRDPQRRIQSHVPQGLPLIQVDAVLIAQLLSNLIDNALKYSAGRIDVVVAPVAQSLQVHVKDRGEGIPEDQREAVFEPYSRNDHSGQRGAGLGLAVCRAIAQVHGGTLTLHSRKSGGSTFTLTLPLDAAPPLEDLPPGDAP